MWTRSRTAARAAAVALTLTAVSLPATAGASGTTASSASTKVSELAARDATGDLAALVNPFIGTSGGGNVFPGADTPFGMLQWSPDTARLTAGAGYSGRSADITGFSLTHMSGPGCRSGDDVPVLPTLGTITPTAEDSFSHSRQSAQAGYYSVRLRDGIGVQLTATTRTGLAEFSFPSGRRGNLIFKLNGSQNGDSAVSFRRDSPTLVQGAVTSRDFSCGASKPYTLYFEMRFSRSASRHGTFEAAAATAAGQTTRASRPGSGAGLHPQASALSDSARGPLQLPPVVATGAPDPDGEPAYHGKLPPGSGLKPNLAGTVGAYVSFAPGPPVLAKVGISYVSAANAAANLAAEDPGWSFTTIKAAAQSQWNALLGRIAVTGGTRSERVVFYTALYHALLAPSVFSDDNGQYTGADGKTHSVAQGQAAEYTDFSGWDIYRTQAQLEALLDPAAASGAAQSMLNTYDQTGMLPKWQAYGRETYVMDGDPADAILADYYAFGATGFDAAGALSAMISEATTPGNIRPGLSYLENLGYLPQNGSYGCCNYHGSVSTTLEYDTADFAISALAGALGDPAAGAEFRSRAHDWHNLVNPHSKLMQPRLTDGRWSPDFSPTSQTGFVEGDSWQYTGMVPFDIADLAAAKGGRAAMARYLNRVLAGTTRNDSGTVANMANEPSIELPWEYDYIGEPYATQRAVRRIQDGLWRNAPGGIPGDDDLGAMSAWFVWSALGMYPMTPGTATLALGSPLFSRAVIELPAGNSLQIIGSGAGPSRPYVRSATWDGSDWTRAYAPLSAITSGGTLDFRLGSSPDRSWADLPRDAPPSYGI